MKRSILFFFLIAPVFISIFALGDPPNALSKEQIELTMVNFAPAPVAECRVVQQLFVDVVNEKAKGELKITVKGGPEVVPSFNQPVAVQKGIVDMAHTCHTFMPSVVPGSELFRAADFTPSEVRKRGFDDFFRERCAKSGIYYLGAGMPLNERAFYILSKKVKFMSQDDFKGKRIAGSPPYFAFFKGLGAVPQTISSLSDYFSLMERGIIDAHIATFSVFLNVGTYEIGKYMIDHPFFNQVQALIMNLEKWQSLPKHLQDIINETVVELETSMPPVWNKINQGDRQKITKGGVEFYKLPPDVAKWYLSTSIDASWKEAEGRYPAELVNGYRKYLRR